ncbi:hypothetical protein [Dongia sp.]|uniref:hypothetical protein n=1 Tax=Dongia sp. TaxID=1977262 RepID=UPI0035AFD969
MISTEVSVVDVNTLARMRDTAARAMNTSLNSYRSLLLSGAHQPQLSIVADEVSRITIHVAEELLFLCDLAVSAGVVRDDLRQKLAHVVAEHTGNALHRPIDLRRHRVRRLPAREGLHCVMDALEAMCDRVDQLICSLKKEGNGSFCESN